MSTRDDRTGAAGAGRRTSAEAAAEAAKGATGRVAEPAHRSVLMEWVKSLGLAVVLYLVIRTFLLQSFYISSGSMEPSLLVGDVLMVSKASYGAKVPGTGLRLPGWDEPSRGEIAIFRPEHDPGTDVVKRIVGVPGDTLEMRDRVLYLNGERHPEPYVKHEEPPDRNEVHHWMTWQYGALLPGVDRDGYTPSRDDWGPFVVPEGSYFVMGDNRERSLDSRFWGFLEEWRIRGKVSFLYWSYDPTSPRPLPVLTAVRWDRLGMTPGELDGRAAAARERQPGAAVR